MEGKPAKEASKKEEKEVCWDAREKRISRKLKTTGLSAAEVK